MAFVDGCRRGRGAAALATQHWSVNIDPSDRYVQSLPGTDRYRLRPDESGYDNLVLAGDWTDSGINAGCIEAAVMSGLQAANALLGRSRFYRFAVFTCPDINEAIPPSNIVAAVHARNSDDIPGECMRRLVVSYARENNQRSTSSSAPQCARISDVDG